MISLVVSGVAQLRVFIHAVQLCAKMSDQVSFEPTDNALMLRAVASNRSTHLLLAIDRAAFEKFHVRPGATNALFVSCRALLASVLRSANSTLRIEINHSDDVDVVDKLSLTIAQLNGIVRHYSLNLTTGESEKASVSADAYPFEAVADPRGWASFFNSFNPTTQKITVVPSEMRLTLVASESFRGAAASSAASALDPQATATTASIEPRQFHTYRFTAPVAPLAGGDELGAGGAVAPTIVAKSIDFKPVKLMCLFADQMGLKMRLLSGAPGLPVSVDAAPRDAEAAFLSHLSLLVAALDVDIPQQLQQQRHGAAAATPAAQRPSARRSVGSVPPPASRPSMIAATGPSGALAPDLGAPSIIAVSATQRSRIDTASALGGNSHVGPTPAPSNLGAGASGTVIPATPSSGDLVVGPSASGFFPQPSNATVVPPTPYGSDDLADAPPQQTPRLEGFPVAQGTPMAVQFSATGTVVPPSVDGTVIPATATDSTTGITPMSGRKTARSRFTLEFEAMDDDRVDPTGGSLNVVNLDAADAFIFGADAMAALRVPELDEDDDDGVFVQSSFA